jgi:hypothetical protein
LNREISFSREKNGDHSQMAKDGFRSWISKKMRGDFMFPQRTGAMEKVIPRKLPGTEEGNEDGPKPMNRSRPIESSLIRTGFIERRSGDEELEILQFTESE